MTQTVLVLIDIQREYTTPDRPFYLKGVEPSLAHCRAILGAARSSNCKIIHVKHLKAGSAIFSPGSVFSDFVEGFEARSDERVMIKSLYSCYSNSDFATLMEAHQNDSVYIIGYNTIMCCLSTLIEGYHRGHRLTLVEDAAYAKSTEEYDENEMHAHAISLIKCARYGAVITTEALLAQMSAAEEQSASQALVST